MSLVGLPVSSSSFADEESEPWQEVPMGEFYFQQTESLLEVQMSSPLGCSGHASGCAVPVSAQVMEHLWEVWFNPTTGVTEHRPLPSQARDSASLVWSLEYGDASLNTGDYSTDASGTGAAALTFGASPSRVRVEASYGSATPAVGTMDLFPPEPESWWFDHSESLLNVTLGAGTTCAELVTAQVMVTAWEVWHSNQGRVETRHYGTSPASGASLSWSLASGSTGSLSSPQSSTGADGCAQAVVTVADQPVTVQVEAGFAGGTAQASLEISPSSVSSGENGPPSEVWTTSQSTRFTSLTLTTTGSSEGLSSGDSLTLVAQASGEIWETGTSNLGGSYHSLVGSGPVPGVAVTFLRLAGDASEPDPSPVVTDDEGRATVTLTMGAQSSGYVAQADSPSGPPVQSPIFYFTPLIDESDLLISTSSQIVLSLDEENGVLSGSIFPNMDLSLTPRARIATTQIWQKSTGEQITVTEYQLLPASVRLSVNAGNEQNVSTDSPFLLNTGSSVGPLTLRLITDNLDPSLNLAAAERVYNIWVSEPPVIPPPVTIVSSAPYGQVLMTLTNTSHPLPNQTCQVNLSVTYKSWDLAYYSDGSTAMINTIQGPAKGAEVTFSIPETDTGILSKDFNTQQTIQTVTDQNGTATVTFMSGEIESLLQASASFAGSYGSASKTIFAGMDGGDPNDPWVYDHTDSQLQLQVTSTAGVITTTVSYRTQKVFGNNAGQTKLGTEVISPVSNAIVLCGYGTGTTGINGIAQINYASSPGGMYPFTATWNGLTLTSSHEVAALAPPPPPPPPPTTGGGGNSGGGNGGTGGTTVNCDCSANQAADEYCNCSTQEDVDSCASIPCKQPNINDDCGCGCTFCSDPCDTTSATYLPPPCSNYGRDECECGTSGCNPSPASVDGNGDEIPAVTCGCLGTCNSTPESYSCPCACKDTGYGCIKSTDPNAFETCKPKEGESTPNSDGTFPCTPPPGGGPPTVELKQENMPNFGTDDSSTDMASPYSSATISGGGVAYITGQPAMPKLKASFPGLPATTNVEWKLEIKTERSERGTKDDKNYPTSGYKTLPGNQAWDIGAEFGTDFVGGKCKLFYKVGGGAEQMLESFIRGKNPLDEDSRNYAINHAGASNHRAAWAICQHESRQGSRVHNQFNASGSTKELPNFSGNYPTEDGWGIAQLDRPMGVSATRDDVYSWKSNINKLFQELDSKKADAERFIRWIRNKWGNDARWEEPPVSWTVSSSTFDSMALAAMVLYNGASGIPSIPVTKDDGSPWSVRSPWSFDPSRPAGNRWVFRDNVNPVNHRNYATAVITDEWEHGLQAAE